MGKRAKRGTSADATKSEEAKAAPSAISEAKGRPRGATVDRARIRAAIFRVVSIIHASAEYPRMHSCIAGGIQAVGDGGDRTIALVAEHAEPELIQNLLLVATSLRVHHQRLGRELFKEGHAMGWLIDEAGQRELHIKDACDKIIHADDLRFGGGTRPFEVKAFERTLPGPYVIQTVHAKGMHYAKPWKVVIDLGVFCEEASALSEGL